MVLTLFDGSQLCDLHISTMLEMAWQGAFAFSKETQITFGQRRRETQQEKTAMHFKETFLLNIILERGEIEESVLSFSGAYTNTSFPLVVKSIFSTLDNILTTG